MTPAFDRLRALPARASRLCPPTAGRHAAAALAMAALLAAGCRREEKVIGYKPFFAGLEGASGPGLEVARDPADGRAPPKADESDQSLVRENPDGSKTLVIRNGRHLIAHVRRLLAEGDAATFVDQVLSPVTRREFIDRGLDPTEAFAMLKAEERELSRLFALMPLGEHTPNVVVESLDPNARRVRLTRAAARGLKWIGFDMVLERGRMVPVPPGAGAPARDSQWRQNLREAMARARTREEAREASAKVMATAPRYRWEPGQWRLRWFIPQGE